MLSILLTSFKEPNVGKAIKAILEQEIPDKYELIIAAPDEETEKLAAEFKKTYPQIEYFKDPGKGKSFALNLLFKEAKGDILILTDGDVVVGKNSIKNLLKHFSDKKVGVVSGRPVSSNSKDNMMGFWSHLLLDAGAHSIRKEMFEKGKFLEASGYLFGLRAGVVNEIPLDVAEDAMIPYLFLRKGYKIAYAEDAPVYVKNPNNFSDFVKQRVRTAKAHEKLTLYVPDFPKVKSFANEVLMGWHRALSYPKTPKEFAWTLALFPARTYIWACAYATRLGKKYYTDAWEKIESTK